MADIPLPCRGLARWFAPSHRSSRDLCPTLRCVITSQTDTATDSSSPRQSLASTSHGTICLVVHSLNVGGTEVLAARLAWQLADRFRFVFACLDDLGPLGHQLAEQGYRVEVLHRKPGLDVTCARRLAKLVAEENVGLLHAHQYTPFSYAIASGLVRRRPPVLFTEHGRWYPDVRRPKRVMFNRMMLRRRDRVVGVGEWTRQALINNEGIPSQRVEVIYNGVPIDEYARDTKDRAAVRRELQLADDDFVMIQVARLDALKDHATAIRTLGRLVKQRPNARLLLIGEGPEAAAIRNEIADRRLESHVQLLGLRDDVARLLPAADLFLLTSVSEGIPLTLIEAMVARLPIVSTDVGGVAEVVVDGETGLLAPSGDHEKLADAVLRLAGDRELCQTMGDAGYVRATSQFSERQNHEHYARVYEEMLGG